MPRTARALLAVLIVEVLLFGASTVPGVRSGPGFDPLARIGAALAARRYA